MAVPSNSALLGGDVLLCNHFVATTTVSEELHCLYYNVITLYFLCFIWGYIYGITEVVVYSEFITAKVVLGTPLHVVPNNAS